MKKMFRKTKSRKYRVAFSLIESMIAVVILAMVIGAVMTFRYYTVVCAERAENQLMASRTAYLLSEAWKGQKADADFDPTQQDFDEDFRIEKMVSAELLYSDPVDSQAQKLHSLHGLTILGDYRIQVDDKQFLAQFLYGASPAAQDLRAIHILIVWQDHRGRRYEYYLPTLSQS